MDSNDIVIIIAPADDLHAVVVEKQIKKIERSACPILLDLATFSIGSDLTYYADSGFASNFFLVKGLPTLYGDTAQSILESRHKQGKTIDWSRIRSIWRRRPRKPLISHDIDVERFRQFALVNTMSGISGWLASSENTLVVNDPFIESRAGLKLYQLEIARRCGCNIPDTCITNDPEDARSFSKKFFASNEEMIYKPLSNSSGTSQGAQIVKKASLKHLDSLKYCPTIFQKRIKGPDIRAVVIGKRIFAIQEDSKDQHGQIDIRMDRNPLRKRIDLPEDTVSRLLSVQESLQLKFGAYDLKLDPSGRFWFLEVNPSGQWLWLETKCQHPISESLGRYLLYGEGAEFETIDKGMKTREVNLLRPEDRISAYERLSVE